MCEYWRRMFGKKSGVFLLQSIIRRQLRKSNIELPCRVPWERSYWNSWERSSLATSTEKMNGKKSKKSNQEKQFVRSDFFASFMRCNAWCKRNMQVEIHHTIHPHPEDLLLNHKTFKNYMNKWFYNQDTHWEAESNQLRTTTESWGSMFPCSQQNLPCVPVFPESISLILVFPAPQITLLFPCSQFYFPFVPMLPKS